MKKILLFIISLLILTSCQTKVNLSKERTFLGYLSDENNDMVLALNTENYLTTVDPKLKDQMIDNAKEVLYKYHKFLDSHHYYKDDDKRIVNMRVLNEKIGQGPIKVDSIIVEALSEAINMAKLTKGYFNPTMGNVSKLYEGKFLSFDSENTLPSKDNILENLKGVIPYTEIDQYIIIDNVNNTVELKPYNDTNYLIDLGAFSKGFVTDKIYESLRQFNSSFLYTAGSSSIITYNADSEDISWSIGIKDPDGSDALLAYLSNNTSISSSGDYEQYFFDNGKRYHHILNPDTGISENYYRSITLTSSTKAMVLDALTTALFNINDDKLALEIIKNCEDYYKIKINYCYIKDDYNLILNKGFNGLLIESFNSSKINNVEIR